jgi:hypothetical protein
MSDGAVADDQPSGAIAERLARLRALAASLLGREDEAVRQTAEELLAELRRLEGEVEPSGGPGRPRAPAPALTGEVRFVTGDEFGTAPEVVEPITVDRATVERVFALRQPIVEWIGQDDERAAEFGTDPVGVLERLSLADAELAAALRRERAAQEQAAAGHGPDVPTAFRAAAPPEPS